MINRLMCAALLSLPLMLATSAHANLIGNGGFEYPNIKSGWTYGQDTADGWQGDNIEVWASGLLGVTSYEGSHHGELNAHPYDGSNYTIYQTFATEIGATYEISFAYRARKSTNEAFSFQLFTGDVLNTTTYDFSNGFDLLMDDHTTSHWSLYTSTFIGTGLDTTLMFSSINPDKGTVGNLLDAVSVTQVPEPGTLAVFGLGLLCLSLSRRNLKM